jgi:hypothetical protein
VKSTTQGIYCLWLKGGIFKFEDLGDYNAILETVYVEACNFEGSKFAKLHRLSNIQAHTLQWLSMLPASIVAIL